MRSLAPSAVRSFLDPPAVLIRGMVLCAHSPLAGPSTLTDIESPRNFYRVEFCSQDTTLSQANRFQYFTATHLFVGDIIAQDVEAAAEYYEKAAKAGFIWAMINLGAYLTIGAGRPGRVGGKARCLSGVRDHCVYRIGWAVCRFI